MILWQQCAYKGELGGITPWDLSTPAAAVISLPSVVLLADVRVGNAQTGFHGLRLDAHLRVFGVGDARPSRISTVDELMIDSATTLISANRARR